MGAKEQVVHVHRVHPLFQKDMSESEGAGNWTIPLFQHVDSGNGQEDEKLTSLRTTYSGHIV